MKTEKYFLLQKGFCESNNALAKGVDRFCYAITVDGRFVASIHRLSEFPELFDGMDVEIVDLSEEDFPK